MEVTMFNAVELTDEEKALEQQVRWEEPDSINLEAMGKLAESLFGRKAVSPVRLDYFTKPEMNIGGHRKSRAEVFEDNGTTVKAIFRHGNFARHLRYFIFGPNLPDDTIQGFRKIIGDDEGTSGELLNQITAFVRSEVRQKRLSGRHEEFFKLAHELEKPEWAEPVRSAAMSVR
jgi:hypothetical protein